MNTLTVTLNQTQPGQDCDLYVKLGSVPNLTFFDYRDTTMSSFIQLRVPNAATGEYDIGVYGFKECSYTIKAVATNECPNSCSGASHGSCTSTTACRCTSRFSGTACETMVSALGYEAPITGLVNANFWNYCTPHPSSPLSLISLSLFLSLSLSPFLSSSPLFRSSFLPSPPSFQITSVRILPITSTSPCTRTPPPWTATCM
jgi:hypothetical protein